MSKECTEERPYVRGRRGRHGAVAKLVPGPKVGQFFDLCRSAVHLWWLPVSPEFRLDSSAPALRLHTPSTDTPEAAVVPRRRVSADLIDAYWDEVQDRVNYLPSLMEAGRYSEVMTLCATYLEGVAHALVSTAAREETALASEAEAHASDPFLSLVHPQQLVRVATQLMGISAATAKGFAMIFDAQEPRLLFEDQAVDIVRATLPPSEATMVERVMWKCTVAYIIYDFMRCQAYERKGGVSKIGLGAAFYEGESVQGLSVQELVGLLHGMVTEARTRGRARGWLPETA
jgi:hypothetical protein